MKSVADITPLLKSYSGSLILIEPQLRKR